MFQAWIRPGECAKVTWEFLGISMPAWVLINLVGLAALGVMANLVLKRKGIGIRG